MKKKIYRATKSSSHQPKVRWAEMGSHSQDFTLSKKQIHSNCHMFEKGTIGKYFNRIRGFGVFKEAEGRPPKLSGGSLVV